MANNIIKIKRSTGNSAPSSLNAGELAFTGGAGTQGNNGQRLFIGDPANSNAVTVIGGNYFTNLMDHAHGTTTASSALIVDGNKSTSELRTAALFLGTSGGDTQVTATGTELNIMDGGTSATSTTLVDADRLVVNDNGVMKQVALTDFETYFEAALDTLPNVTSVGTLTALAVDNVTINTNTISTTNSNGDLILAPNGSGNVAMTTDTLSVTATEGESATLLLSADESDDNGDDWSFINSTANTLTINNDISGSTVAQVTLTPHATVTSSTTAIAGNTTVGGTLGVTGVISPTTHVDMPDSAELRLGDSDDLKLYHDGTNSYIENDTGALKIATETSGIAVTVGHTTSEVTFGDNVTVTGNLTVAGTTTTVNSTTVSIADPIFELGSSSSDDNLDRGISMKYNSSGAKTAFMGFDDSDGKFTMIPDATDTNSVFTGSIGVLKANIETGNTGLTVGGSTPFSDDGSGALTLQNVDVLDATTEATIEAAIDTLSNLTSVGTLSTGVWQATPIGTAYGGTGLNAVGTSGKILVSNGSALAYQDIDGGTFT